VVALLVASIDGVADEGAMVAELVSAFWAENPKKKSPKCRW